MNEDVYSLNIFDDPANRPEACKQADPDNQVCQLMGERTLKGRIVARRRSKSLVGLAFRHLEQEVDARRASLAAQESERLRAGRQRQRRRRGNVTRCRQVRGVCR